MKGVGGMNTLKSSREKETSHAAEPYRFTKRLGSTVYEVNVCFNQDAKETMEDKIMRLIRNEAARGQVAV
jgi:hypothetical protein